MADRANLRPLGQSEVASAAWFCSELPVRTPPAAARWRRASPGEGQLLLQGAAAIWCWACTFDIECERSRDAISTGGSGMTTRQFTVEEAREIGRRVGIRWPVTDIILSPKDEATPLLPPDFAGVKL